MRGFGREEILLDWNEVAEQFGMLLWVKIEFALDFYFILFFWSVVLIKFTEKRRYITGKNSLGESV